VPGLPTIPAQPQTATLPAMGASAKVTSRRRLAACSQSACIGHLHPRQRPDQEGSSGCLRAPFLESSSLAGCAPSIAAVSLSEQIVGFGFDPGDERCRFVLDALHAFSRQDHSGGKRVTLHHLNAVGGRWVRAVESQLVLNGLFSPSLPLLWFQMVPGMAKF
jgi:hypothetical protein